MKLRDPAVQERFRTIHSPYRGAQGIMLVFDISNRTNFNNLNACINEIRRYANEDVVLLLIGNRSHLSSQRAVSKIEAKVNRL